MRRSCHLFVSLFALCACAPGVAGHSDLETGGEADSTAGDEDTSGDWDHFPDFPDNFTPSACDYLGFPQDGSAVGGWCTADSHCDTGICAVYTDVETDTPGECADYDQECGQRYFGTARGFGSQPLSAGSVQVLRGDSGSSQEVLSSTPLPADGRFNTVVPAPLQSSLPTFVEIEQPDGQKTTVAAYPARAQTTAGRWQHDFFSLSKAEAESIAALVAADPDLGPLSPDKGIVVGVVRRKNGQPLEHAAVTIRNLDTETSLQVKYPSPSLDELAAQGTSASGLFIAASRDAMNLFLARNGPSKATTFPNPCFARSAGFSSCHIVVDLP